MSTKTLAKAKANGAVACEADVVHAVTMLLTAEEYRIRHEVPNMGQSADIVATKGSWVTIVEAKVRDWRSALRQCIAHQQVADFICIALAVRRPAAELMVRADALGYGIIRVHPGNAEGAWIKRPRRNARVWRPQRRRLIANMRSIEYVG